MNSIQIFKPENISATVQKIKNGELKSYDLVKEHIERAKKTNPEINAFITIIETDALEKATRIDKRIAAGEDLGKLAGIPFTAKDLYLVENVKTTFGSRLMEDFVAPYTSTVLQKCLDEGAILIAKANCDPWGFGGSGENSGFGPTKHPMDLTRSPGGSSSGSAAGLLAGVGLFSLGTDTGGSVRLPASFCGLYGLKPTYGRNSRYGIGAMASSFDTPAFFANYLEDIAMLEEIMAGKDINDGTTSEIPVPNYSKIITEINENSLKGIRIGIPKEYFGDGLDESIRKTIDTKVEKLKKLGAEIKEVSIPSTDYGLAVYYILVPAEISSNRARYDGVRFGKKVSDNYEENLIESRSKYLEAEVKRRIMIGTYSLSKGYADQFYKQASKVRTKLKREFEQAFKEVDVMFAPVAPNTAIKLGEKAGDPVQMYLMDIYTVTANIVGIPSLAVPIGQNSEGLPIGMQIMGKHFDEENVLKIAKFL